MLNGEEKIINKGVVAVTYSDVPKVLLTDYIEWDKFRTILADCRNLPCGVLEIPVIMELKKSSVLYNKNCIAESLKNEKLVYGFVTAAKKLFEILEERNLECKDVEILLNEWDKSSFLMIFKQLDATEEPIYFVEMNDVSSLLENCLNPNLD